MRTIMFILFVLHFILTIMHTIIFIQLAFFIQEIRSFYLLVSYSHMELYILSEIEMCNEIECCICQ